MAKRHITCSFELFFKPKYNFNLYKKISTKNKWTSNNMIVFVSIR